MFRGMMNGDEPSMDRDRKKREFAERYSLLFEQFGMPRVSGRIFGWLLVCDPPHQSAEDLLDNIGGSRSSISTMTRLLHQMRLIERVAVPGDRKRYWRIRPGMWTDLVRARTEALYSIRDLAKEGLAILEDEPRFNRLRLEEMHGMYSYFLRELPGMIEQWEAKWAERERPNDDE